MLRSLTSNILKFRFALWAIEMALPSGPDLKQRFRSVLLGIMAAVAGGVLAACAAAALLAGAGYALYYFTNLTITQTIIATSGTLMVIILCLFAYGWAKLDQAFGDYASKRPRRNLSDEDTIRELVNGFVEGLVVGKEPQKSRPVEPVEEIKPAFKKAA